MYIIILYFKSLLCLLKPLIRNAKIFLPQYIYSANKKSCWFSWRFIYLKLVRFEYEIIYSPVPLRFSDSACDIKCASIMTATRILVKLTRQKLDAAGVHRFSFLWTWTCGASSTCLQVLDVSLPRGAQSARHCNRPN